MKILVTTYPFGNPNPKSRLYIQEYDVDYNNIGREYKKKELIEKIKSFQPDYIIAGTEKYDVEVLEYCSTVKIISRVGIGLDSVDLETCRQKNIMVCYTPDAPSNAVAEMTLCQMINALRFIPKVDNEIRNNMWNRYIGRELCSCNVGIIGFGRIGRNVANKLLPFNPKLIMVNDIDDNAFKNINPAFKRSTKNQILIQCDVVSIHIPYNSLNHHYIKSRDLSLMKQDAVLINTARGNIVKEDDLVKHLEQNQHFIAAVDVYTEEPYCGPMTKLTNCILTPHLGSCSQKSRFDMEIGACESIIDHIEGNEPRRRVI